MKNKEKHIDPEVLISKYLADEASDAEIKLLESWVIVDDENRRAFLQAKKAWNLSLLSGSEAIDIEKEWMELEGNLFKDQITIKLSSFTNRRDNFKLLKIAAVFIVLVAAALWMYQINKADSVQYYNSGEALSINELSDGSVVSLNQDSELKFKPAGSKNNFRHVELIGDAFFEVKPDKNHPFLIAADELKIKVLGTSFYVNARRNKATIEVTVKSGSVSVKYVLDSLILNPGEKAIFDRQTKILKRIVNDDINYLAWKTKILIFEDVRLSDVVDRLNEVYHADIELEDQQLKNCKITVTFKEQDLESILLVIGETLDFKVTRSATKMMLSGEPCE